VRFLPDNSHGLYLFGAHGGAGDSDSQGVAGAFRYGFRKNENAAVDIEPPVVTVLPISGPGAECRQMKSFEHRVREDLT